MVLRIKDTKLRDRVMKKVNLYSDLAIKAYNKGDMKKGAKYEAKSDKLYADNYNKMFEVE